MELKYREIAKGEGLYLLICKWVHTSYHRSCAFVRRLDNSIEFQDIVNDCFIILEPKNLPVYKVKSYVGSIISNKITKLKKRKEVEASDEFLNCVCVVNLTSGEYYNEFDGEIECD